MSGYAAAASDKTKVEDSNDIILDIASLFGSHGISVDISNDSDDKQTLCHSCYETDISGVNAERQPSDSATLMTCATDADQRAASFKQGVVHPTRVRKRRKNQSIFVYFRHDKMQACEK